MLEAEVDDLIPENAGAEALLFARRLRPQRSLRPRGRGIALAVFALPQGAAGLYFCLSGAWPVAFFLALTWLGLVLAFNRNARAALAYEDLHLSPVQLHYARVDPAGHRRDWRFNPLWVRLEVERHSEFGVERLDLFSREKSVQVGAFLGRSEKTRLARDLSAALAQARQGPRFPNEGIAAR